MLDCLCYHVYAGLTLLPCLCLIAFHAMYDIPEGRRRTGTTYTHSHRCVRGSDSPGGHPWQACYPDRGIVSLVCCLRIIFLWQAKLIDISIAPQRQNLLDSELPSTKASVAPVAKELAKANNRDLVLKYRDRVSQALRSGFALKQEESLVHSF